MKYLFFSAVVVFVAVIAFYAGYFCAMGKILKVLISSIHKK